MHQRLRHKILELFEYRKLPQMAQRLRVDGAIYPERLIRLQEAIFKYDQHLEQNWEFDEEELEQLWFDMKFALKSLGYNEDELDDLLSQIHIYAKNEKSVRNDLYLSDLPIKYFYYYKSCDVRLMRRILLDHAQVRDDWACRDWILFDWVTEVNDDVADVREDIETFNGNRFLECLRRVGVSQTLRSYDDFLIYIKNQNMRRKEECMKSRWGSWIWESTLDEVEATRKLLIPELYQQIR